MKIGDAIWFRFNIEDKDRYKGIYLGSNAPPYTKVKDENDHIHNFISKETITKRVDKK